MATQRRMHQRFESARRIEQSIAFSDLDRAHREAHELATFDEPDASLTWRPYFDAIRDAARQVELSGSVGDAARRAATLGLRCADCHDAIAARVTFPVDARPPEVPRLAAMMLGHQWAATQMWFGLIGPADDRWLTGARAGMPEGFAESEGFARRAAGMGDAMLASFGSSAGQLPLEYVLHGVTA